MKKILFLIVLVIAVYLGYNYIYQDHRDIQKENAEFVISADDIQKEFQNNSASAEKKYINKTIQITGVITELNEMDLTLQDAVFCQFKDKLSVLKLNGKTTIKGRFIGYDDLLEIVKLDQCSIK